MHTLKFRSWDARKKVMDYPDHIANDIDGDRYGIMQYTGLKDKNGKEIFEGDIVNLIPPGYMNDGAVVVWSDDEGCWIYRRIYNDTGIYAYKWRDIEVIGNIYSNPELVR